MHDIDRTQLEYGTESEEWEQDWEGESDLALSEAEEMELAAELLQVADEAELEQFLGRLFKTVGKAAGKFVRSPVGRALGGALKGVVKKALPAVGSALGTFVAPGVGTAIGGQIGNVVSQALEMELEGMGPEDQEFETARNLVRIAGTAVQQAAQASGGDPQQIAKSALTQAVKQHLPGAKVNAGGRATPQSGRWVRRGRTIVLLGI